MPAERNGVHFTFVTLFSDLTRFYFEDSILKRALEKELFSVEYVNPREFSTDKHRKVDDYQSGGGAGLVMTPQPLFDTLNAIRAKSPKARFLFMAPAGAPFTQNDAVRLAGEEHLVLVSGRYEGIDERVVERFADEVFSVGDYILTGGELPSLVICDAVARNIPGVLGNQGSLDEESFNTALLEAPSFTKPAEYEKTGTPSEFLKGNHSRIAALNFRLARAKTQFHRPDLFFRHRSELDSKKGQR